MKNTFKKILPVKILFLLLGIALLLPYQQLSAQRRGGAGPAPARNTPARKAPAKAQNKNIGTSRPAVSNSGNKTNINSGNKTNINSGNKNVNIDNSRNNNVNINVNKNVNVVNNRNTVVRRNTYRPYVAPPYRYGGHRYYAYHPYYYHPYHPFYWGPVWHPWGFVIATLATTAIIISVENQKYHYDQGVYYQATSGGYTVVPAPVGATITTLPAKTQTVVVNETTNNYYYGGTYYEKADKGYKVVAPTAGTIVESLPEGGKEVTVGDQKYVKFGETYYQPIQKDGKNMYEVATVEEDK